MKDIAETKEEKYTQLKKKLEKQGFLAKRLIRVMRYKYKCYFGTELPNGDAFVNECRRTISRVNDLQARNDWWYKESENFTDTDRRTVSRLESQLKELTEDRANLQRRIHQRFDDWEKGAFINGDEIRIDNIIRRLIAKDDEEDLPLPDDHDTAKQVLEQAVRCMGALLSLGHIERKKIVQCKFEKLLVQFHRKFFYSTEKEVAVQLIEGINEVK